jgi:hypothetical protein
MHILEVIEVIQTRRWLCMKKISACILGGMIILLLAGCSAAMSINEPKSIPEPGMETLHKKGSVLAMDDLQIIKRAADYLKARGEEVSFQETHMELHFALDGPAILPVANGDYIEYGADYLEVRLYQFNENEHEGENFCQDCLVVYMTEDGGILGYTHLPEEMLPDIPDDTSNESDG